MAKKPQPNTEIANVRTSGHFDYTEADSLAAQSVGIVLAGSLDDRTARIAGVCNTAARLAVEAGYLLLSIKADLEHGDFAGAVDSLGLSRQRASELMQMAKFTTALPEARRIELFILPRSKVLLLASADAEVVQDLLDDPDSDLSDLSVRGLRQRIRELEAEKTDMSVERDKAKLEAKAAEKKLKRRDLDQADAGVPIVVLDLRAELAALAKKAELAVDSFHHVGVDLMNLRGHDEADHWVDPTVRLAIAALASLRVVIDGQINSYCERVGFTERTFAAAPDALSYLGEAELLAVAKEWAELAATHAYERTLREHERESAKPRGKGRPAAAPVKPTKG